MAVGICVLLLHGAHEFSQLFGIPLHDVNHRVRLECRREHALDGTGAPVANPNRVHGAGKSGEEEAMIVPPRKPPDLTDA